MNISSGFVPSRGRARFGVLVPFTNSNLEADMAMLCPAGVSMHFARLGDYDEDEIPDEKQMAGLGAADLSETLRLIGGVKPDVVLYGCTSATLTHGVAFDRDLAAQVKARLGVPTVTAAGSLVAALSALGIKKIAFASPYVAAINKQAIAFLEESGFQVVSSAGIEKVLDNTGQGALTPEDVKALARRADSPEAEALVLSCTDMRSVETVEALEAERGKPLVTSNQALLFTAMQALGLPLSEVRRGRLFRG